MHFVLLKRSVRGEKGYFTKCYVVSWNHSILEQERALGEKCEIQMKSGV